MGATGDNLEQGRLEQGVRLIDGVTLGAGASIGVAIFSVLTPAAQVAGPGLLLSLCIAAIPMVVFAVTYAFMASAVPVSGASFAWPSRFVHPFFGFMIAWLRILGSAGAMAVLALVLVQYLSMVVPLPTRPAMFGLFCLFFVLNLLGVSTAARLQTALIALLLVTFVLFVIAGSFKVDTEHFQPLMEAGWGGVFGAVPLLISLFLGIEAATEVGEEVRGGGKTIARGIAIAVTLSAVTYFAVSFVALGVVGAGKLAASQAPLLDAANRFLGVWATPVILIAAVTAIGTSLNGVFMIFTRYLFAMGRAGALPARLALVHPRWGTPHIATVLAFACCVASLLLPESLVFLFLAINIPTMLKYMGACLSATRLLRNYPELHRNAGFRLEGRVVRRWAWAGVLCAILVIAAGFNADWRPYAVLGAWAVIGAIYWFAVARKRARLRAENDATSRSTSPQLAPSVRR